VRAFRRSLPAADAHLGSFGVTYRLRDPDPTAPALRMLSNVLVCPRECAACDWVV